MKMRKRNRNPETSILFSIEETIADVANSNKPLLNSRLIALSNLDSEEQHILEQAWVTIEMKRRQQIVYRLVELSEGNFELNFDSIFKICLKDQDKEVRSKAIEGLWENEEVSLISPLVNLLEQDTSEKVQAAAATALGKFAMLGEYDKLRSCHTSKIYQALITTINTTSKALEVRRRALEALAPLSIPQVKKIIAEAYQSHNFKLKISAIYAMGKNCDRHWLPTLLKELANADAEIRYEAAGACGELGEEEAVSYLVELIIDTDVNVQLAAIQALGKIGSSEAKTCLERCLNSPSETIRQVATQALNELETWEDPLSFRV
jgi:HEAT repeat protein